MGDSPFRFFSPSPAVIEWDSSNWTLCQKLPESCWIRSLYLHLLNKLQLTQTNQWCKYYLQNQFTESVDKPDLKEFSEEQCSKSEGKEFQTRQTLTENIIVFHFDIAS